MNPALHSLSSGASSQPIESEVRATGIRAVGDVRWGTHFFLFQETKEDLLDALVPYFKVGLENRELCIWVISDPLTKEEARDALRQSIPDIEKYVQDESMQIVKGREWYMSGGDLDLGKVARVWNDKLEGALARGYCGLRLSGDTAWLDSKHWKKFAEYENEINHFMTGKPTLALCTYPLRRSSAEEILDVTRTHQFAIARRNGGWEVVETSELKQAKAEIKRLNDELGQRVVQRTQQLTAVNEEMRKEMIERQRAEEALLEAQAALVRVTRALDMGELAATIAHEVNQPLTAIVTNGNFCLRRLEGATPNLDEFRTAVTEIVNDGARASAVISRIRGLLMKGAYSRTDLEINKAFKREPFFLAIGGAGNGVPFAPRS